MPVHVCETDQWAVEPCSNTAVVSSPAVAGRFAASSRSALYVLALHCAAYCSYDVVLVLIVTLRYVVTGLAVAFGSWHSTPLYPSLRLSF